MGKKDTTSAIIDGLLVFGFTGGLIFTALAAPNAVQIFGKPLDKFFDKIDKRSRERETRRIIYYMKQQGLIKLTSEDYEHGLVLTEKGKARANKAQFDHLSIERPKQWDERWRMVIFDIPEIKRNARNELVSKLRHLGFVQLQMSAWIHPFPCRDEVEAITDKFNVRKYVSYVEIVDIDNRKALKERFKTILNKPF